MKKMASREKKETGGGRERVRDGKEETNVGFFLTVIFWKPPH